MEEDEFPLISPPTLYQHSSVMLFEETPDLSTPTTEEDRPTGSTEVGVPSEGDACIDNSWKPRPAWDSTPIAPESFRDQLFLSLAKDCKLGSDHASQESQQVLQQSALHPSSGLLLEVSGSQRSAANCQQTNTAERLSKEMHRRAELNRQAQRRFRDRHKVHAYMLWLLWHMVTHAAAASCIRSAKKQSKPNLL